MRSITVVGASPAGLSTVRTLRAEGYDGEIVVVGEERRRTLVPAAAAAVS
jgi:3-phenylpropionate/trans-cinnamate dioxygenase ferredoxin reductase subunit